MPRLTETDGLTDLQRDILRAVREFTDAEILPVASELDHSDTYPDQIVAGLRELGVFGLTIDPAYGGLASEYAKEVVEDALRIHGGYGYSQEYEIERLYRDVPMLLIGEGTAEIQKMIIGRRLLDRFAVV